MSDATWDATKRAIGGIPSGFIRNATWYAITDATAGATTDATWGATEDATRVMTENATSMTTDAIGGMFDG